MAAVGSVVTIMDMAKRLDPNGAIAEIIEVLAESNPILQDAHIKEGNLPTGHRTTVRTGLPTVAWRLLNYGVQPSKSTTKQVDDQCGMLEGYSRVDKDLANLNGNAAAFRASEDNAFVEAMSQEMASTLFYGDTGTDPEKFLGLDARFNDTTAANGTNVIKSDGVGADNTSIWLVTWGEQTCHLMFPKGSKAGLQMTDLGEQIVQDSQTPAGLYQALVSHFQWKIGLVVRDWRYIVRIANIDISNLTDDAATGTDLIRKCIEAYYKRPSKQIGQNMAKTYWYCNKTLAEYFHVQAMNKSNVNLQLSEAAGEPVVKLCGAPIHICDAITETESLVS